MLKLSTIVTSVITAILGEETLKLILINLLKRFAENTSTTVDDRLVRVIEMALDNKHDVEDLETVVSDWKRVYEDVKK